MMGRSERGSVAELARRVGLGLTARGELSDVVRWAARAQGDGLESLWLHETYFERDSVTYATAVARAVPRLRIALGAVTPYTRHPVLLAMTLSSLDSLAPGRIVVALGSGLPLRLAQMGLAYDPDDALERAAHALEVLRRLARGERLPAGLGVQPDGTLPPVAPMFPPLARLPIYAAGYRRAYVRFAGQSCDGYLARPMESVPSIRILVEAVAKAAAEAGRAPDVVDTAGYLLALVDDSRRSALDRAKREPFVIYMLAVQSEVAMRRAGLDPTVRRDVMAAWRAEDYTGAARLIPDELLDAFVLCGTREQVAARADAYREAGLALPLLQPVLQEEEQVRAVLDAAVIYGRAGGWAPGRVPAPAQAPQAAASAAPVSAGVGLRRRARAAFEIARPFSLTASAVPVLAAGGLALTGSQMHWAPFVAALAASVLLQVGTNTVNEIYDVRQGVDDITSPRASKALVTGRITERGAFAVAAAAFGGATALGGYLLAVRGWPMAVLGVLGLLSGWGYTAPPLQYKFRALGLPLVFVLMGPLMVLGGYLATTGHLSLMAGLVSVPIGLLVTAILHGNEWRDAADDARAGISTASIRFGPRFAHVLYLGLVVGAFMVLGAAAAFRGVPPAAMLAVLSLPLLVRTVRAAELGASGQRGAIARIDLETARLHAAFGALLTLGLAVGGVR